MRNKLYCASYLVFAAALATTGSAFAASLQANRTTLTQSGNGAVTVPPGVARGYGDYADGTPCMGTPKDPTAFPDKTTNPCDGKPLAPERIPGPYPPVIAPPVNVTAPGGQTAPEAKPQPDHRAGQFAPYEDGTPCVGRPRDLARRPNKETNPCVAVDEPAAQSEQPQSGSTGGGAVSFAPGPNAGSKGVPTIKQRPDGSLHIEYANKHADKPVYGKPRGPWVRPQQQGSSPGGELRSLSAPLAAAERPEDRFDIKQEPGDQSRGEQRTVSAYERSSGRLVYRIIHYLDGRRVIQYSRASEQTLRVEIELVPVKPQTAAYYTKRLTTYAADGVSKVKETSFRPDGTVETVVEWDSTGFVRTYYDTDGTTVLRKVRYGKDGHPFGKP